MQLSIAEHVRIPTISRKVRLKPGVRCLCPHSAIAPATCMFSFFVCLVYQLLLYYRPVLVLPRCINLLHPSSGSQSTVLVMSMLWSSLTNYYYRSSGCTPVPAYTIQHSHPHALHSHSLTQFPCMYTFCQQAHTLRRLPLPHREEVIRQQ